MNWIRITFRTYNLINQLVIDSSFAVVYVRDMDVIEEITYQLLVRHTNNASIKYCQHDEYHVTLHKLTISRLREKFMENHL